MRRNVLGGLVIGLAATGLVHALHFAGLIRTPQGAMLMMLVLVVHVLVLAWVFRRHVAAGQGRFVQLLGAGMLISLVAGLAGAAGSLLYTEVTDPGYLGWLGEESARRLESSELPADEKERRLAQLEGGLRQPRYALQTVTGSMVSGLLASLLLAAILRRREAP